MKINDTTKFQEPVELNFTMPSRLREGVQQVNDEICSFWDVSTGYILWNFLKTDTPH